MTTAAHKTTPPGDSTGDATPPPMFSDKQLRRLKVAVIVMGLVLIVGFGVVIGRIIYLVNRMEPPPLGSAPAETAPSAGAASADVTLSVPAGAVVRHLSIAGDRLAVHYDSPGGSGIVVVNPASGQVIRRIRLTPEAAVR
jgi:hypothetical protein